MTNYDVIETLISYNKEYNHVDGHSPEELDKADKKSMLRTRKGLMMVLYALDDYFYNEENRDKMTHGERVGASEVFENIHKAIYKAIEELDDDFEARGFLPRSKQYQELMKNK
tara:strand:+ start:398 stop:736 length:339 start_codon:yes stop_codon:yes gene_type:complete